MLEHYEQEKGKGEDSPTSYEAKLSGQDTREHNWQVTWQKPIEERAHVLVVDYAGSLMN